MTRPRPTAERIRPSTISNPMGDAYRTVRMGDKSLMIRELVRNGEEKCQQLPRDQRLIRIYATPIDGVPKLTIWNRGGMPLSALKHFAHINVEIDKTVDVDANFGRGAKASGVRSNQLGMRYRSCFNHRVLEVTIVADPESKIFGVQEFDDAISGETFVRDVTDEYPIPRPDFGKEEQKICRLDQDWTEVVLYGNEWDQNTVTDPYSDEVGWSHPN
jgi:hypothetical protein